MFILMKYSRMEYCHLLEDGSLNWASLVFVMEMKDVY